MSEKTNSAEAMPGWLKEVGGHAFRTEGEDFTRLDILIVAAVGSAGFDQSCVRHRRRP
jgi:hypothetical protein